MLSPATCATREPGAVGHAVDREEVGEGTRWMPRSVYPKLYPLSVANGAIQYENALAADRDFEPGSTTPTHVVRLQHRSGSRDSPETITDFRQAPAIRPVED
jgi:hypothetical protein